MEPKDEKLVIAQGGTSPRGASAGLLKPSYAFYADQLGVPASAWNSNNLGPVESYVYGFYGPEDAADANVTEVNSAKPSDAAQSVLAFVEESLVLADSSGPPQLRWAARLNDAASTFLRWAAGTDNPMRANVLSAKPRWGTEAASTFATENQRPPGSVPAVKAIFVALGRSSGAAFTMTVAHASPQPLNFAGGTFVLTPVGKVTAAEAERELRKVGGSRHTATINAYCLQFLKPPPPAGMIYRLARNTMQQQHRADMRILRASRAVEAQGLLRPDSDPAEYAHSIRQWAIWTREQGFADEATFGEAFIAHAQKNYAGAGRPWSGAVEAAIRNIVPNRWRDIRRVIELAGM